MHIIFIGLLLLLGVKVLVTMVNFIILCEGDFKDHSSFYYVVSTLISALESYFLWYVIHNIQVI